MAIQPMSEAYATAKLYPENRPRQVAFRAGNGSEGDGSPGLVPSAISRQHAFSQNFFGFHLYRQSVRVLRKKKRQASSSGAGTRGEIDAFSYKSRRRLEFTIRNTAHAFVSQIALTYHHNLASDGQEVKRHLDNLLRRLRTKFPFVKYLWILEFQQRGVPHYHLFLTVPPDKSLHEFIARSWNRITGETEQHLAVHLHEKNFIPWSMETPGYLTKYLHKENQKHVPSHYLNVGRFWGCSRGLVSDPEVITKEMLGVMYQPIVDAKTGEIEDPRNNYKEVYRILRKWHEAKVKFAKRKRGRPGRYTSPIARQQNYLMMGGAAVVRRIMEEQFRRFYVPF